MMHSHERPGEVPDAKPSGDQAGHGASACDAGDCRAVAAAAEALLAQCEAMVLELPDTVYTSESVTIRGGTVGKHLRHLLDHYSAALAGVESGAVIDYDHRDRNVPMETDRRAALAALAGVRTRLSRLTARPGATHVRVRVMIAGDGTETELTSTLAREIAFATHHGVHHQAMMRAIAGELGIELAEDFGKAPSTVHYERGGAR